ncbi:lipid A biosynthesis lauroyl acyltransferase [Bartonella vinsonii]|uniref:Lipid A biosynthesis lauroyl acyltransferase n=1 Tax=Bartonella vinsonii subsp. berkhoffii str. Tweed TaxID=1094502 RepID=N6VU72_BARVB|nr:lipid A biosynthesis lauroyl acyltransferase [Bartonella vinsonii]ENN94592.1 lipid A biosynthesis lauroyl acyltransferase [Bartonella vinsonii subsp. berkhoffii str. Tweed]
MNFYIKIFMYRIKIIAKKLFYLLWGYFLIGSLFILKYFPSNIGLSFFSWLAKTFGPLIHRHQIALANLKAAYPEKTKEELHTIAIEMWENIGLFVAEYIFLDKIFDFDPHADQPGLIEVKGAEIFQRLKNEKKPHIFFTAHSGNFELLPICAQSFGLNVTVLFRPPNNPYIAKRVLKARQTSMGHLVPSKAGAAWALAAKLAEGKNVGMLVDQKFRRGILGTFFNRPLKTNPLIIKLARQYDCDIYPARCIRLAGGRHRLELYESIKLPLDEKNEIDIAASTQKLNDIVESWVREYPGQWTWLHRRWDN